MPSSQKRKLSRHLIHSLQFLRVLALLGVFAYHLLPRQVPHGYLGVVTFFILAGFLSMQHVLLREAADPLRRYPRPNVGERLWERFLKLYPPLIWLCLALAPLMYLLLPAFLDQFAGELRSALLGFNNIWQILRGDSYFEGAGYVKPLTHLWALSLEMQFYLLFSLLVEPLYRARHRLFWTLGTLFLTLASAADLILQQQPGADLTRIYYGPDTRFFQFTLGMLMALLGSGQPCRDTVLRVSRSVLTFLLLGLAAASYFAPISVEVMMPAGFLLYSALMAFLVALVAADDTPLAALGRFLPIRGLAAISYPLYLWHYPAIVIGTRLLASVPLELPLRLAILGLAGLLLALIAFFLDRLFSTSLPWPKRNADSPEAQPEEPPQAAPPASPGRFPWDKRRSPRNDVGRSTMGGTRRAGQPSVPLTAAQQKVPRQPLLLKLRAGFSLLLLLLLLAAPWDRLYVQSGGARFRQLEADIAAQEAALQAENAAWRQQNGEQAGPPVGSAATGEKNEAAPAGEGEPQSSGESSLPENTRPSALGHPDERRQPAATSFDGQKLKQRLSIPRAREIAEDDWKTQEVLASLKAYNGFGGDFFVDPEDYQRYRDIPFSMIGDSVSVIASYVFKPYWPQMHLDALSNRQTRDALEVYRSIRKDKAVGNFLVIALGTNGDIDTEKLESIWKDLDGKPLFIVTIVLPYDWQEEERNAALRDFAREHDQVWLVEWQKNAKYEASWYQEDAIHPSTAGSQAFSQLISAKIVALCRNYEDADLVDWQPALPPVEEAEE